MLVPDEAIAEDREFTMMESRLMLRFATELTTTCSKRSIQNECNTCVQQLDASNRYDLDLGRGPSAQSFHCESIGPTNVG